VLSSQVASSLPTLPFHILRLLFNSKPLSSEEGVLLREVSLQQGAMQLVLMCLGVLSHHDPRVVSPADRLALQTVAALTGKYVLMMMVMVIMMMMVLMIMVVVMVMMTIMKVFSLLLFIKDSCFLYFSKKYCMSFL